MLVDKYEDFCITDKGSYILIYNKKKHYDFDNFHTHLKPSNKKGRLKTAQLLIYFVVNEIVPSSNYLQMSAIRISTNDRYIAKIKEIKALA